ncbi:MAG: TnpV protein [Oscillospiraceae bacterium]|nr:TnpV protein [Oscillospiraceae bacterium]
MSNIEYAPCGDYLLPLIKLSEPPPELVEPLGRYARMRRAYLREHRPILYSRLLLSERLFPHLREVDEAARSRLDTIADREQVHEIICAELVYD